MNSYTTALGLAVVSFVAAPVYAEDSPIEETTVIAERLFMDTTLVSPTSQITAEELASINMMTSEDAIAHEPSLVVRRRFVGDPNGTIGIRGSGMFQTARSMVFADGLPLHYLLQTRWSGSPRWSLIAPNEIEMAEVIYGPFSAEYSGNAMGGVINLKTKSPDKRRMTVEGSLMSQDYKELGTDETYGGNKFFASFEDRIGNLGIYASYNHLENQSQPMSNYTVSSSEKAQLDSDGINGYIPGKDDGGNDVLYIGDSGAETAITDLYKVKVNYDLADVQLRATVAYEDRQRDADDHNNYLTTSTGDQYWGIGGRNFQHRHQERESLLLGVGLSGNLSPNWFYDIYMSEFTILSDEEVRTDRNPNDPSYLTQNENFRGRLTEHGDTGWHTLDLKLGTDNLLGSDDMRLSLGYHQDRYRLEVEPFNINSITGELGSARDASGGDAGTRALFAQWGWGFDESWDLALGLRYEDWKSSEGYLGDEHFADRSETGLSPKLSLAFFPSDKFSLRFSMAKAHRFPIVEELFSNESRTTSVIVSDPSLEPEVGVHHNLTLDRKIIGGFVRLNLFYDQVEDTIYNQRGVIIDGGNNIDVSTFLAVDEVQTRGVEVVYNQAQVLGSKFNVRFNATYLDAEITKNSVNPEIEGNDMPRIPAWRANLILSYQLSESVDVNTNFRYASNSFGDLDNGDTEKEVYGAIDRYFFTSAKVNWMLSKQTRLSLGVDNLFNELAYVAHPWPSRTLYLEGKIHF